MKRQHTMVQPRTAHFVRDTPTSDLANVMANPDSFRLFYFPIEGLGQTSRDILIYADVKWERIFPEVTYLIHSSGYFKIRSFVMFNARHVRDLHI